MPKDWPNFDDFEKSNASLKVWLPQILVDRINWISKHKEVSRPDIVRAVIFENAYGKVAYEAFIKHVADKKKPHWDPPRQSIKTIDVRLSEDTITIGSKTYPLDGVRFSRERETTYDLKHLGKSDEDLTISLPATLKTELKQLAGMHGLTPSSYVRKLLVLHLLGEKVHTQWQKALGKLPTDLNVLEQED